MTSGMTDPQVLVDVRGVGKRFGAVLALGRVDLQLRRGECVGLVGPNGAGTSTLVNVLCGALAPDQGELHIAGWSGGTGAGTGSGSAWGVREAQRWDRYAEQKKQGTVHRAAPPGECHVRAGLRALWGLRPSVGDGGVMGATVG